VVDSVPVGDVMVLNGVDHDNRVNGEQVESGVEHQYLIVELLRGNSVSNRLQSSLSWGSPLILIWVWLISIIVGLDQEPLLLIQLIKGMNTAWLSLNDSSFVSSLSRHNVVHRTGDLGGFEVIKGQLVVGDVVSQQSFSHQSAAGQVHSVEQIVEHQRHILEFRSGVHIDCELVLSLSSKHEHIPNQLVESGHIGGAFVDPHLGSQFGEVAEKGEIEIPSMHDDVVLISDHNSGAEGAEFVSEIGDEDVGERYLCSLSDSFHFFNVLLVLVVVFGVV